jgi:hypothetical protein
MIQSEQNNELEEIIFHGQGLSLNFSWQKIIISSNIILQ